MRGKKGTKGEGRYAANLLLTSEEKASLEQQADMAGLSVSAYLRRRFFGGRPLIAHTDAMMIRELRRIGACSSTTLKRSGSQVPVWICLSGRNGVGASDFRH